MYTVLLPAVGTAIVPETELKITTSGLVTTSMTRPCTHVVAVLLPDTVVVFIERELALGPVYKATLPAMLID